MGVLPVQFAHGATVANYNFDGTETLTIDGLDRIGVGMNDLVLRIVHADGTETPVRTRLRLDTRNEIDHLRHNGTLPYVVRKALGAQNG
jgi:aconitate hydratase